MRGGFRGRGRGRGGGPGDARAMQALRDPPKAPGVLYPPFGDPAYLAPPTEFEDLVLQYSMQLEDTLRDGIGIPYAPPPPVRSQEELAAEKNASGPGKRGKGRDKGKKANGSGSGSGNGHGNGDVDMEDLGGHGYGNGKNGNETGFEGFEAGPSGGAEAHYAEGGIGPDQEAFHGWRIPDARRFVGVEIDDLNDRPSKWGVASSSNLRSAGASDKLDKDLLCLDPAYFPPGLWDAHFVDDERSKRAAGKRKRDDMRDDGDLDLPELDNEDDRDSNASSREDPDQFGDEEEMDHEDYDANYFDNGEGDDDEGGGGEEGGGDDF